MEAQLHREDHHPHVTGLHHEGMEGDEYGHHHHGEKKSVLKKVKDKAKKMKDTITKHGHGHGHDHHMHEEEDDDDVDDDDQEMVNDPEVHGAPIYESTVIRSTNLPRQIDVNLEKPTDANRVDPNIDRHEQMNPNARDERMKRSTDVDQPNVGQIEPPSNLTGPSGTGQVGSGLVRNQREKANVGDPMVKIGSPVGLEEDPHSPRTRPGDRIPPSNYQSKVVDPTGDGGKEAEVEPLLHRLDNLNLRSEREAIPVGYTGSHDQFAPQSTPTKDEFASVSNPLSEESTPKTLDSDKLDQSATPRDTVAGKISSATALITDTAIAAKNVVASKLGYGVGHSREEAKHEESHTKPMTETATEYAHAVYGKVAGVAAAVTSKVHGGGEAVEPAAEEVPIASLGGGEPQKGSDKGVSVKGYFAEKFKPGDEDKALSEAITDAFHKKKEGKHEILAEGPGLGKVTESKEVAARLGTRNKREGEDALLAGIDGSSGGGGVVDRLKGAVGSWLGKSTGTQTAQESLKQSHVSPAAAGSAVTGGVGGGEEQPRS